jgi:hypothetical protein
MEYVQRQPSLVVSVKRVRVARATIVIGHAWSAPQPMNAVMTTWEALNNEAAPEHDNASVRLGYCQGLRQQVERFSTVMII